MVSRRIPTGAAVLLIAALSATSVSADALYRWTDADGQVHFSDRAPAPGAPGAVEALPTPQYTEPGLPAGHYSVVRQLQRMQAERLARERERRERERQARELALREREVEAAERAADQADAPSSGGTPVWILPRPQRPRYRPGRPSHAVPYSGLWKPDHPAYRPPTRPHRRWGTDAPGVWIRF